jgi:5-methylcytosine-specific restriction endonuclease McrA
MVEEEIFAKLLQSYSAIKLLVWRRANFRCEYCGKCLISSPDAYYYDSQIDHIVPQAGDDECNLALACRACNYIKRATLFLEPGQSWPTSDPSVRADVVARAAAYIGKKRQENQTRLERDLDLLRSGGESRPGQVLEQFRLMLSQPPAR